MPLDLGNIRNVQRDHTSLDVYDTGPGRFDDFVDSTRKTGGQGLVDEIALPYAELVGDDALLGTGGIDQHRSFDTIAFQTHPKRHAPTVVMASITEDGA